MTKKRAPAPASAEQRVPITDLQPDPRQIRRHNEKNLSMIGDGLKAVGAARSIVLGDTNEILAGNGTIQAAVKEGFKTVRVIEADGTEIIAVRRRGLTEKQKVELALYDNRSSDFAEYDGEAFARITDLVGIDADKFFTGAERAALLGLEPGASGSLADRFGVPPFSVLDARQGYWQARKAAWLALGIESEVGRGPGVWVESETTGSPLDRQAAMPSGKAAPGGSLMPAARLGADGKTVRGDGKGRPIPARINRNLQQSHEATTANIDFYSRKRALEKERGERLSTKEAKVLLAARIPLADHRAAHRAAIQETKKRGRAPEKD